MKKRKPIVLSEVKPEELFFSHVMLRLEQLYQNGCCKTVLEDCLVLAILKEEQAIKYKYTL